MPKAKQAAPPLTEEEMIHDHRRRIRALEHLWAQQAIENTGVDEKLLSARFAVKYKGELDALADLVAAIESSRVARERELQASFDGLVGIYGDAFEWQKGSQRGAPTA